MSQLWQTHGTEGYFPAAGTFIMIAEALTFLFSVFTNKTPRLERSAHSQAPVRKGIMEHKHLDSDFSVSVKPE